MLRLQLLLVFFCCLWMRSHGFGLQKNKEYTGIGTYYDVGGLPGSGVNGAKLYPGSCNQLHKDTDMVVALNDFQMGFASDQNKNKNCGRKVEISLTKNGKILPGKTVTATIVDTCPRWNQTTLSGCKRGSLDLSPAVFKKFAPLAVGEIHISWHLLT